MLRTTLQSTNPIESLFATVRAAEGNIKRYRSSAMMQRWLASVLLYGEQGFRRINGSAAIPTVLKTIEAEDAKTDTAKRMAA